MSAKTPPKVPRCKECGLRIRRPGHSEGHDHIDRKVKRAAQERSPKSAA